MRIVMLILGQKKAAFLTVIFLLASAPLALAQFQDTDGDGLLDLVDVEGVDPGLSGVAEFRDTDIEDLDGASLLANLQRLDLRFNRITSIESGDFNGLGNLQELWLDENEITSIESSDFDGLANLEELGLGRNRITSIENGDFDGLTNLQSLDLGLNQITSIENGDLNGLGNLTKLGIALNEITSIESGDFDGLTNLQRLDLERNQITSIESGDFDGLDKLQRLNLIGNQITSIENGDFDGLANLRTLDLVDNHLIAIESEAFAGLINLQELFLNFNEIANIESGGFDGLINLQELRLSNNQITRIESGAFDGLTNLQQLNLRGNEISELNFSEAGFESLAPCSADGFCVDGEEVTSLLLDNAQLGRSSFTAIVGETTSITEVSLDGLTFIDSNPENLKALLGIRTLDNVTVDPDLYSLYQAEFDAFAAIDGNSLTVTAANLDCNEDGTVSILDANCTEQLDNLLRDLGTVLGDLDGIDGVQFPDFLALSENFGLSPAVYTDGDIDKDGAVGFGDFLTLSENFGQVAASESVPEPSGIALLGMLAVYLGCFRQSRS